MTTPLQSALHPAGPDAAIIAQMSWVLFGGAAVIFVAVMALLVLSMRPAARPVATRWWIAGAGIAFPVVVLTALLVWSTWRSAELTPQTSRGAMSIGVTAKMWWWEVRYHDPASGREVVSANEIRIPVGRPVYVGLTSTDVIHSLWIPALNGKMDTIPGRVNGLTLQADKPGIYRGQCAEYCGAQHARMALHVVAMAPDDFARWLAREAQPASAPDNALVERGRAAFLEQRCQSCHTIRGLAGAEHARLGPDLTHVGGRTHIAAGTLRTHSGTLAGWIANPQAIKPGARMPAATDIDGATLHALAAYLEQLK
ncbi:MULTISPECIES: cytochrome c oxidase subunit II [unclassified Massilia]|uniref:cytochrome c oxidase subunit II n=1 Tax=unclassified Massilia TaxID=2609279 RepID=UPI001784A91C|nr:MULTISPECIES: cytochrome c oxidase subunit II [unclassified Massilia]MBD8533400.1 cytochrome c oxidase subunit II [Massilia sp. CFBP 13647]MBD8676793.1 cytochrome c oxidase subunit II [Massilia sp. CFBP 13721]